MLVSWSAELEIKMYFYSSFINIMLKNTFILFIALLCLHKANAQAGKDTTIYFLKNSGLQVFNKDSADYIRFILPNDANDKKSLYPVIDYYPNGKRKLIGASQNQLYPTHLEGMVTFFTLTGKRRGIYNFNNGRIDGDMITYYPNGQIYTIAKHTLGDSFFDMRYNLVECHDSTGKVLAENGKGHWLKFTDDTYKTLYQEGEINNGLEQGAWDMYLDGKKLSILYKNGIVEKPVTIQSGNIVSKPNVWPSFPGENNFFTEFVMRNVNMRSVTNIQSTSGTVIISFVVERDGCLSNVKVTDSETNQYALAIEKAARLSPPWKPGLVNGEPVRTSYFVSITVGFSHSISVQHF